MLLATPDDEIVAGVLYILSMVLPAQRGEPFILYFTPPVVLRLICLAAPTFIILQVLYGAYTVGPARLSSGFRNAPYLFYGGWWRS